MKSEAGGEAVELLTREGGYTLAYGATLLALAATESFVAYLQLGDGDILAISDKTGQVESPMPSDDTLLANETTSLCMEKDVVPLTVEG